MHKIRIFDNLYLFGLMKKHLKKSLIFLFAIYLINTGCSIRKNDNSKNNELSKPEVSSREGCYVLRGTKRKKCISLRNCL